VTASLTDTRSAELYRRAQELIPGGVNSPVRAMRAIGRAPLFIARGEGAELIDVDGNRFVDYVCSWGPLIHGHAHPRILEAVRAAVELRGAGVGERQGHSERLARSAFASVQPGDPTGWSARPPGVFRRAVLPTACSRR
jgi:glutamate-1-semialdehyde aminotransferase